MRTMSKLAEDENGQTLVLFAVFISLAALGFLAFAVDVGSLFHQRRVAQAAADAAAVAAAEEASEGATSNEQTVANAVAKLNGFDTTLSSNPATVTLSTPVSGNFTGPGYVQATVSMPVHTIFMGAFSSSLNNLPVSATSIAGGTLTQTCVCLEASTGSDILMSNGSKLVANACGIVNDSSSSNAITLTGGATISGLSLGTISSAWNTVANINNGASIASSMTIVQGMSTTCNPTMPTAPSYTTSSCLTDPGGSSTSFTAGPASSTSVICYKGLTVGANGTLDTLKPGIYVITNNNLHFLSGSGGKSNLGGQGVFFYLTNNSTLQIDNGANVNLTAGGATESTGISAPTVGSGYDGILLYQSTGDATTMTIQSGTDYMNGALYLPSAELYLANGSGSTMTGGIVAASLNLLGGATLTANADLSIGSTVGAARLVQ